MKILRFVCLLLVIVGGINWGLVGLAHFNLVSSLLGSYSEWLVRGIYIAVGLSAIFLLAEIKSLL